MSFRPAMTGALLCILLCGFASAQTSTSVTRTLVGLTTPQDDYPEVSPDGRQIVFQSNRSGTWQLWIMNRDGSGLHRLTHGGANDRTPAWSPDGARIMFSSDRGNQLAAATPGRPSPMIKRSIYLLDLRHGVAGADARVVRVLESPTQDVHPKWANSGRSIIFNRVSPKGERDSAEIMVADADGSNSRRIDLPKGINTYASVAPDGSRIVFRGTTKEMIEGREADNSDIFSARADGSDRRRLTSGPEFDGWPALSPDGQTISFSSRRSGNRFQVYTMPIEGGIPQQVTFGDYQYTQASWSPDGKHLVAYRWIADAAGEIGHLVSIDLKAPWPSERP